MVQTMLNLELFDRKWLIIFDKMLKSFLEHALRLKQLFDAKLLFKECNLSVFQNLR